MANRNQGGGRGDSADDGGGSGSLLDGLLRRAGKVAGGTIDLALDVATTGAMFGDARLRDLLASSASPERLEAMAEAGRFLRDARQTAGLSLDELADRLEVTDEDVLRGVEEGRAILPLELMLRAVSLLARHDPLPFLIKFLRSYNPGLEAALEQWGVMALPRNFERERRFINLYRQHDFLRSLSDDEYQRFIEYMDASTGLVVEVMQREGDARARPRRRRSEAGADRKRRSSKASSTRRSPTVSKAADVGAGGAGAASKARDGATRQRPKVRKVKPRNSGS